MAPFRVHVECINADLPMPEIVQLLRIWNAGRSELGPGYADEQSFGTDGIHPKQKVFPLSIPNIIDSRRKQCLLLRVVRSIRVRPCRESTPRSTLKYTEAGQAWCSRKEASRKLLSSLCRFSQRLKLCTSGWFAVSCMHM
jgi:hypothetical protein